LRLLKIPDARDTFPLVLANRTLLLKGDSEEEIVADGKASLGNNFGNCSPGSTEPSTPSNDCHTLFSHQPLPQSVANNDSTGERAATNRSTGERQPPTRALALECSTSPNSPSLPCLFRLPSSNRKTGIPTLRNPSLIHRSLNPPQSDPEATSDGRHDIASSCSRRRHQLAQSAELPPTIQTTTSHRHHVWSQKGVPDS
jgi:hypothetical protein